MATIRLRFTRQQWQYLRQAARLEGVAVETFIWQAALDRVGRVLLDAGVDAYRLNGRSLDDLLEHPPVPTPALLWAARDSQARPGAARPAPGSRQRFSTAWRWLDRAASPLALVALASALLAAWRGRWGASSAGWAPSMLKGE